MVNETRLEERESVTLHSHGDKIFGVLHRPISQERVPAVLMCHGFAGTKVGRYRMYVRLAEALAAVGIASLRIDFRGCGDSEGNFVETTLDGQVSDALLALQFLREHPQIDYSRIGLLGRSLGGPVAVLTAAKAGDVRSIALWAAVFHGDPWLASWEETRRQSGNDGSGGVFFQGHPTNPQLFVQLLKLNMEKELHLLKHLPLMCVHSEKDEVVGSGHADRFRESRKSAHAPSNFVRLLLSSHDFSDYKEQELTLKETTEWYERTLKNS